MKNKLVTFKKGIYYGICTGKVQQCAWCFKDMYGKKGISIKKGTSGALNVNIWICMDCIVPFGKLMVETEKMINDEERLKRFQLTLRIAGFK